MHFVDPISSAKFSSDFRRSICINGKTDSIDSDFIQRCINYKDSLVCVLGDQPDTVVNAWVLYPNPYNSEPLYKFQLQCRTGFIYFYKGRLLRESSKGETVTAVPVGCIHFPKLSISEILTNPEILYPEITRIEEWHRKANLGFIGWLFGLRHTVIAFQPPIDNRCNSSLCPPTNKTLLLDKTGDGGVWFRYKTFWESYSKKVRYSFESSSEKLNAFGSCLGQFDFNKPMTHDYTCQHFVLDSLRAFTQCKLISCSQPLVLYNKKFFDSVPSVQTVQFSDTFQEGAMRVLKSTGVSHWLHEKFCSWRHRYVLEEIEIS